MFTKLRMRWVNTHFKKIALNCLQLNDFAIQSHAHACYVYQHICVSRRFPEPLKEFSLLEIKIKFAKSQSCKRHQIRLLIDRPKLKWLCLQNVLTMVFCLTIHPDFGKQMKECWIDRDCFKIKLKNNNIEIHSFFLGLDRWFYESVFYHRLYFTQSKIELTSS